MGRWGGQAVTYAVALKGSEHRQELPARVEVVDFGFVLQIVEVLFIEVLRQFVLVFQ